MMCNPQIPGASHQYISRKAIPSSMKRCSSFKSQYFPIALLNPKLHLLCTIVVLTPFSWPLCRPPCSPAHLPPFLLITRPSSQPQKCGLSFLFSHTAFTTSFQGYTHPVRCETLRCYKFWPDSTQRLLYFIGGWVGEVKVRH